jgi:hypothetical protein
MNSEATIYEKGNPWQRKVYHHMAEYLESKGITSFGESANGNAYKHLLTGEQSEHNFITREIHQAALDRFDHHKAGDKKRILTNTAASQPYCFNLVIYLEQHRYLANQLFSKLLGKPVKVRHIEPEFTPNNCNVEGFGPIVEESIVDQNGLQGTDADIAVFYTYDDNKKGILLIEFKFIEAEFSTCSTFRNNKNIREICCHNFYNGLIEPMGGDNSQKDRCGYKKYENWQLTKSSRVFDLQEITGFCNCPFIRGENQLWRNMLLAEKVASERRCDEFGFWVFSPKANDKYLWGEGGLEKRFRLILSERGNSVFKKVHLETVFSLLNEIIGNKEDKE